jgi:hypothetical protein
VICPSHFKACFERGLALLAETGQLVAGRARFALGFVRFKGEVT